MFRCEITGKVTKPGEKMKKLVMETRERVYYDEDGYEIGRGSEIVKEISVSEDAYRKYIEEHPEKAPVFKSKKKENAASQYSVSETPVYAPPPEPEPVHEPSALEKHLADVQAGRLVPVERNGRIEYVSSEEARK
jgi:hypothetical protein